MQWLEVIFIGVGDGYVEYLLLANRVVVGLFFAFSGYHKLFVAERHEQLVKTLEACGIPFIWFCQWLVPLVELFGGLAVLVGFMAPLAALGLLSILAVALATDGPRRVKEFRPIDMADTIDDWLYLPETTYVVMVLLIVVAGPGAWSAHHLFF